MTTQKQQPQTQQKDRNVQGSQVGQGTNRASGQGTATTNKDKAATPNAGGKNLSSKK